jgi:formylglycine-generating enzyme required for sulfatase activity
MPVSVTSGTGAFSAGTVVTAITGATTFSVSAQPTTALSGGASVVTGTPVWRHATINLTGNTAPSGTITPASDGTGAFIYRSANGTGDFTNTGAQLRWNYGADKIADGASVALKVFAIEMVYVPGGAFYVGSGGNEDGAFYKYPTTANPYQITSEGAITVGAAANNLYYPYAIGNSGDQLGPIPATFPKGYNAFYCMKYEISQQEYVDFLNSLTTTQASNHYSSLSTGYRYGISVSGGVYSTTNPFVACNFLGWSDLASYLDWSGLRPMTELEFEKSCRGTLTAVGNEYAWGSTSIKQNTGITNSGLANEISTNGGNCTYHYHPSVQGPMRVGAFATPSSTRYSSGSAYYGIMEMSGNVWERSVTIGNVAGRSFTGLHGDGALNTSGDATVNYWPGINGNPLNTTGNGVYLGTIGVTQCSGAGFRGGDWYSDLFFKDFLRVSDRFSAVSSGSGIDRTSNSGGRGVRTAP